MILIGSLSEADRRGVRDDPHREDHHSRSRDSRKGRGGREGRDLQDGAHGCDCGGEGGYEGDFGP